MAENKDALVAAGEAFFKELLRQPAGERVAMLKFPEHRGRAGLVLGLLAEAGAVNDVRGAIEEAMADNEIVQTGHFPQPAGLPPIEATVVMQGSLHSTERPVGPEAAETNVPAAMKLALLTVIKFMRENNNAPVFSTKVQAATKVEGADDDGPSYFIVCGRGEFGETFEEFLKHLMGEDDDAPADAPKEGGGDAVS